MKLVTIFFRKYLVTKTGSYMKNVGLSCPLRMVEIKLLKNKNIMIKRFEVSIISISELKSFQI